MANTSLTNTGTNPLLPILNAEAETVCRFVDLLQHEQNALRTGKIDELADFAEKKSQLGIELNQLAEKRNVQLAASGLGSDREGIEAWHAKHPDDQITFQTWQTVVAQAREARELNRLNGELIKIHLQYNTKALEALRGGHAALELYGPDGQSQIAGNRRINDAA